MGITLRGISHYRPRALTLLFLLVLTGLIVLVNLSFDIREVNDKNPAYMSDWRQLAAGWPLLWRRYFLIMSPGPCFVTVQYYSASRLATNVLLWLAMVGAPAGACEWLARRYRLGLRWSLRTMLAAMALAAAGCGWFVAARNRADIQDPLIATIKGRGGQVVIERWGPKWLDAIGADRFRRRVVGVEFGTWGFSELNGDDEDDEALFKQVARLPNLRYLCVEVDRLSIGMATALNDMPELRQLRIEQGREAKPFGNDSKRISHVCLSHIGKMARLEQLCLARMEIDNKSLACLAGLANLKSLLLEDITSDDGEIMVPEPAVDHFQRALNDLRKSNPGITIDSKSLAWPEGRTIPWEEEKTADFYRNMTSLPAPFGTTTNVAIPAEEAASLNW